MGDEERGQFSAEDGLERGDFSYMDYVPSEPPVLEEVRPSASRPGLRHPSTLLTQPRIPALPPDQRMPARRVPRRALGMGGVALVVLLGVVARLVLFASAPVTPTASHATAAVSFAPQTPAAGSPGYGWVAAGPAHAQAIAFSPSAPGTAYACAPTTPDTGSSPIDFAISTDDGQRWKLLTTQVRGMGCDLTVDPDDANDIVLAANDCRGCQTPRPLALYRTLDAGTTWRPLELPLEGSGGMLEFEAYQWTWAGSTFYLAPWRSADNAWTHVAVSVDEAPFYWADEESLFLGSPTGAAIHGLLGSGDTVYATVEAARDCAQSCSRVMRSADFGMSWTPVAPADAGLPVQLLPSQASPNGATLFGQVFLSATASVRLYVQSTDGGASWQPLPAVPGTQMAERIVQTPDGTLYAALTHLLGDGAASDAAPGVYRLRPGDSAWTFAAEFPEDASGPWYVAWDSRGAPLALWGDIAASGSSGLVIGLEDHTP